MTAFSLATITHALNSDEFNSLLRDGSIELLQATDDSYYLVYTHKGRTVVLTNQIKVKQ